MALLLIWLLIMLWLCELACPCLLFFFCFHGIAECESRLEIPDSQNCSLNTKDENTFRLSNEDQHLSALLLFSVWKYTDFCLNFQKSINPNRRPWKLKHFTENFLWDTDIIKHTLKHNHQAALLLYKCRKTPTLSLGSHKDRLGFLCDLFFLLCLLPFSVNSEDPPWASSVLLDKVNVICRRSGLQRRSWEFQLCWMQKTWWLWKFPIASVSWHTFPSTTTTSMDAPRVSISVSLCASLPLSGASCPTCLYVHVLYVFGAVGGMGGIKRPAEGPTEESGGKKNQPVASKVFVSSKPARENSPPPSNKITKPAPSPKQTRNAMQVTSAAWILYTSETKL